MVLAGGFSIVATKVTSSLSAYESGDIAVSPSNPGAEFPPGGSETSF